MQVAIGLSRDYLSSGVLRIHIVRGQTTMSSTKAHHNAKPSHSGTAEV